MAKKELYVCDSEECGAILVHPEDGFVISGPIYTSIVGDQQKAIVNASLEAPLVFCFDCFVQKMGPGPKK
jgi:hypothetical protein